MAQQLTFADLREDSSSLPSTLSVSSQLPLTPAPDALIPLSGLRGHLHCQVYIPTQKHTHTE